MILFMTLMITTMFSCLGLMTGWVLPPQAKHHILLQFLPGRKAGSSHGKPVAAPVPWSVEVSKPRACFDCGIELATPLVMVIRLFQCVVRQPYLLPRRSDQHRTPQKKTPLEGYLFLWGAGGGGDLSLEDPPKKETHC